MDFFQCDFLAYTIVVRWGEITGPFLDGPRDLHYRVCARVLVNQTGLLSIGNSGSHLHLTFLVCVVSPSHSICKACLSYKTLSRAFQLTVMWN